MLCTTVTAAAGLESAGLVPVMLEHSGEGPSLPHKRCVSHAESRKVPKAIFPIAFVFGFTSRRKCPGLHEACVTCLCSRRAYFQQWGLCAVGFVVQTTMSGCY